MHNNSLDRSGGSVFRIKPGAAKIEWIRAARSTLTLGFFFNAVAYIWIMLVVLHVPVIFASFFLFDRIVRVEYFDHRSAWEADGQPHGFFWVPRESTFAGGLLVRFGSSMAQRHVWRSWLFSTPAWIRRDRHALHTLYWLRGLLFGWLGLFASFILVLLLVFR